MKIRHLIIIIGISIANLFAIDTLHCIAHFENIPPLTPGSNLKPLILGDINADGYDDWAFKHFDRNIYDPDNITLIYMGSDSIDFTPDYQIDTKYLSNVGDINGDGYDDIAYMDVDFYMLAPIGEPKIKILYGGADFDLIADDSCSYVNTQYSHIYFSSLKKIGDINGDGYDDLCCGPVFYEGHYLTKPSNDTTYNWYSDIIKMQVYLGGQNLSWNPDTIIVPPEYFSNPNAIAYNWGSYTGLGDINKDGYDDFSMQYWEYCFNDTFHYYSNFATYVYYGNSSLYSIIIGVDTLFVGDILSDLGYISNTDQKAFFCSPKNINNQIPGLNIVYANEINTPLIHFDPCSRYNRTSGDINGDGYNDWIVWDDSDNRIKGYYGGYTFDQDFDYIPPNEFHYNKDGDETNFYILGDICGDGYDKILFTEKIDDEYYDLYCFSYNEVKTKTVNNISQNFDLLNIYPNPFNSSSTIKYNVSKRSSVDLSIYNVLGQKISNPVKQFHEQGSYSYRFNAESLRSGIYFCVLSLDDRVMETKKIVLLK